jgi:hypothetical protein
VTGIHGSSSRSWTERRKERVDVKAYILIQAEPGADGRLADDVASVPGVRWVERVTGPFDLIAGVESGPDGVPVLVPRIQQLRGVLRALTSLVVDDPEASRSAISDRRDVAAAGA